MNYYQHGNILLEKYQLIYVVLQKNGCTSIKTQLVSPLGLTKKKGFPRGIHDPEQYSFPFAVREKLHTDFRNYTKFLVSRSTIKG